MFSDSCERIDYWRRLEEFTTKVGEVTNKHARIQLSCKQMPTCILEKCLFQTSETNSLINVMNLFREVFVRSSSTCEKFTLILVGEISCVFKPVTLKESFCLGDESRGQKSGNAIARQHESVRTREKRWSS